jgi:hypothetical protein
LKWLGLEQWQLDISNQIDSVYRGEDVSVRTEQTGKIYYTLEEYEQMEVISLLEQAVWKLKIEYEAKSTFTDASGESSRKKVKIDDTQLVDVSPDPSVDRQSCRINYDAGIVISNMLLFLVKIKKEEYLWS